MRDKEESEGACHQTKGENWGRGRGQAREVQREDTGQGTETGNLIRAIVCMQAP